MAVGESKKTNWPRSALVVSLGVWLILAGMLLPSLDGWGPNFARLLLAIGIFLIGVVRWRVAVRRREQSKDWRIYVVLMMSAPAVSSGIYTLWERIR